MIRRIIFQAWRSSSSSASLGANPKLGTRSAARTPVVLPSSARERARTKAQLSREESAAGTKNSQELLSALRLILEDPRKNAGLAARELENTRKKTLQNAIRQLDTRDLPKALRFLSTYFPAAFSTLSSDFIIKEKLFQLGPEDRLELLSAFNPGEETKSLAVETLSEISKAPDRAISSARGCAAIIRLSAQAGMASPATNLALEKLMENTHVGKELINLMLSLPEGALRKWKEKLRTCLHKLDVKELESVHDIELVAAKAVSANLADKSLLEAYLNHSFTLVDNAILLHDLTCVVPFVGLLQILHEVQPELLSSALNRSKAGRGTLERLRTVLGDSDFPLIYLVRLATICGSHSSASEIFLLSEIRQSSEKLFRINQDEVRNLLKMVSKSGRGKPATDFIEHTLWEYLGAKQLSGSAGRNLAGWLGDGRLVQSFIAGGMREAVLRFFAGYGGARSALVHCDDS